MQQKSEKKIVQFFIDPSIGNTQDRRASRRVLRNCRGAYIQKYRRNLFTITHAFSKRVKIQQILHFHKQKISSFFHLFTQKIIVFWFIILAIKKACTAFKIWKAVHFWFMLLLRKWKTKIGLWKKHINFFFRIIIWNTPARWEIAGLLAVLVGLYRSQWKITLIFSVSNVTRIFAAVSIAV